MATAPQMTTPRHGPFPRPWTPAEFAAMRGLGLFAGRVISLDRGVVVEHQPGNPNPVPVVFTRTEYHALWDAQFFRDQRVQLVRGVIVQEPPMNPRHAAGVRKVTR